MEEEHLRFHRHIDEYEPKFAALEQRVKAHEENYEVFRQITLGGLGIVITVFIAVGAQLLLVSGRQEVVLATLPELKSQLMEIRGDLKYNRSLLEEHKEKSR